MKPVSNDTLPNKVTSFSHGCIMWLFIGEGGGGGEGAILFHTSIVV